MDKNVILPALAGVVRHVLTTAGGSLLAAGVITAGDVETVAGAVVVLVGVIWSLVEKRKK